MGATAQFTVKGMTCENCVRHVEKALSSLPGVSSVKVDLQAQEALVDYDPSSSMIDTMVSRVKEAGYDLELKSQS